MAKAKSTRASTKKNWPCFLFRIPRFTALEVKIVAVGRKSQAQIVQVCGRLDLGVAIGGNIAQPQAGQTVFSDEVENVVAIRRDGCQNGLAAISHLSDGDVLKRRWPAARDEGINPIGS